MEVGAGLVNRGAVAALVERKCSYSASPSEAHTAVASNCINEFPGDCSRSRKRKLEVPVVTENPAATREKPRGSPVIAR